MTEEAQRIAIAGACGYKWRDDNMLVDPNGNLSDLGFFNWRHIVPDYLNDLNAMHEVEGKMNSLLIFTYLKNLGYPGALFECVHASAAQRAEAFLRTIGKWVE